MTTFQIITVEITQNYKGILFNAALIIVSALECIVAAVASYRSSRELCPCFRRNEDYYQVKTVKSNLLGFLSLFQWDVTGQPERTQESRFGQFVANGEARTCRQSSPANLRSGRGPIDFREG